MQATVLDFPSSDSMTVTEKRFTDLAGRVNEIGERLAKLEGGAPQPRTGWVAWLPIIASVVTVIGIVVTIGVHLDNKIGTLQKDLQGIGGRLSKVEDAVKVLSNKQSDSTQKLIHDLLGTAKTASDPAVAAKATKAATSLIATLRKEKRPASPQFFQTSIETLDRLNPAVKQAAFKSRIALAEYRSDLEPIPEWVTTMTAGAPMVHMFTMSDPNSGMNGLGIDAREVTGDVIALGPKLHGKLSENIVFSDDKIVSGTQTLDGIHWRNVIFVGSHIRYRGGEVELTNVRFVNCTFDFPITDRGARLADYAALLAPSLTLG